MKEFKQLLAMIFSIITFIVLVIRPHIVQNGNTLEQITLVESNIKTIIENANKEIDDLKNIKLRFEKPKTLPDFISDREMTIIESKMKDVLQDFSDEEIIIFVIKEKWGQVLNSIKDLAYDNQETMEAKTLIEFKLLQNLKSLENDYSVPWNSYIWRNRFEYANHQWKIEGFKDRFLKSIKYGVLGSIASYVLVLLSLCLISWLWYFLLDRISEVAAALRKH